MVSTVDEEAIERKELEAKVDNIPDELLEYEGNLCQLFKSSEQNMQNVTYSLLDVVARMGKEFSDEVMAKGPL